MVAQTAAAAPARRSLAKVVAASVIGTSLEWYDLFIYGSAAALVFPKLFFPQQSPATALLLSLAIYGVAFVARPLGAVIFGHYGDLIGRKNVLIVTLLMMGAGTFVIGLLPTYATIGMAAPVALVVLRLIQGLALGGEWGGAALMVTEYDEGGRRRGFLGSLVQVASPIGLLTANAVFAVLTSAVSPDDFLAWAWRVPFLLSALLMVVGFVIRRDIAETPLFEQIERAQGVARAPILEVFRTAPRQVLLGIGSRIGSDCVFYVFTFFLLIYLPRIGVSPKVGLNAILMAAVAQIIGIPLAGALSDRIGRRPVLIGGALATLVWAYVFFMLVNTQSTALIFLAAFVGMFFHTGMWGPLASFLPEMFATRVRCTGASLSFQLAGLFGNALIPIVATQLVATFESPWPVAMYLTAFLILVAVCVAAVRESVGIDLARVGTAPAR